jgi:hypothetical protein
MDSDAQTPSSNSANIQAKVVNLKYEDEVRIS